MPKCQDCKQEIEDLTEEEAMDDCPPRTAGVIGERHL